MSLLFASRAVAPPLGGRPLPGWMGARLGVPAARPYGPDQALTHSAVWACLRLRADLVSTMPAGVWRERPDGAMVAMPLPSVLDSPDGSDDGLPGWLYASQFDLDRGGNAIGLITETDGQGFPARIELQDLSTVVVRQVKGVLSYRIGGTLYTADEVWHERQFTRSGWPVGLSPVAYAAMTVSGYLSAQQFVQDWFDNGAHISGVLRNTEVTFTDDEAAVVKKRFKASVQNNDVFVTGSDWEYSMQAAESNQASFVDAMKFGLSDAARYFGVPSDLIDAAVSGESITYASISQRNLQLLIMNLGPAVHRREQRFSRKLVARPRQVRLDADAVVLRMDPVSRSTMQGQQVRDRLRLPDELRAVDNLPPYTDQDINDFARLFASMRVTDATSGAPADVSTDLTEGAA